MADENQDRRPVNAPATTAAPAPSAEDVKSFNDRARERIEAGQREEIERHRAAGVNSMLTTAGHVGNRPDEPNKDPRQEAVKVGKALPAEGSETLIPIDRAGKGEPTDTVNVAGFPPGSPIHTIGNENDATAPTPPPDADGTIEAVRAEGASVPKIEGDPAFQAGKDAHAGENALQPTALPAEGGRSASAERPAGDGDGDPIRPENEVS